jgi:hypothetical protein
VSRELYEPRVQRGEIRLRSSDLARSELAPEEALQFAVSVERMTCLASVGYGGDVVDAYGFTRLTKPRCADGIKAKYTS